MKQKRYTEEQIALVLRQAEGSTTVASLAQFGRPTPPLVQSANERWSMDFMSDSLVDGRRFRVLTLVDDFSVGLNTPPLAVDPGRFYRLGEKCNRLFPLGKPHGAYELRRKSPCTIGRVYRTFGGDCKYHVVIVPNYRRRALYGKFRRNVGEILRDLCRQRGVDLLEGTLRPDHVHMYLKVAPKFSIAFVIGFLKGKSAVRIHRELMQARWVKGLHFWSRGYCVSTVGIDERTARAYIRHQEEHHS